jgi:cytochrome c oxidase assembly protein subunit 15
MVVQTLATVPGPVPGRLLGTMTRVRKRVRLTPRQYFLVACAALGTLVLIVFTGAAVRVTGSGLGCPDWPNCYEDGRLTPELGTHSYIEFGNRLLTTVVGLSAVAAGLLAFARRPFRRELAVLGMLLPLGVLGQAVMGGLTVLYGLAPGWVMAHFALSMVILVAAGMLVWRSRPAYEPGERAADGLVAKAVWGLFALGAVTLFAGTAATAAGPHAGGSGTGDIVERLQFKGAGTVSWLVERHSALATLLGLAAIGAWWLARRRDADRELVHRLARICVLMAVQGVLGIVQYQLEVPAEMVWVHVALATLLWVGIVLAAVQAGSPLRPRARRSRRRGDPAGLPPAPARAARRPGARRARA